MVKVSVVVPVYNVEKYLSKCLTSLVNQTLQDIEIIVINDGSTDGCLDIINDYKKRYPKKLKVINNKNHGIGFSRNCGIKKARGKYITFIDSDDYISESALEEAFNYIEEKCADVVVWDYYEVDENSNVVRKVEIPSFDDVNLVEKKDLLFSINPAPWNKLYRTELFNDIRFPDDKTKYEDLMTIPKVLLKAFKVVKLNNYYNYYMVRNSGETNSNDERVFDILKVLNDINNYMKEIDEFDDFYLEIEYLNIRHVMFQVVRQRSGNDKELSKEFVIKAYDFLDNNFHNWKNNIYYKKYERKINRLIQNNKKMLDLYFSIYKIFRR